MAYYSQPKEAPTPENTGVVGKTLRGVSNALWYLDTPAAAMRSWIDYGLDGFAEGSWNDPFNASTRVSSDDLAEKATGVTNPLGKFALGTAIGVATDPLTYVSGPLNALSAGGKAARAAGLLDDAAEVASRSLQKQLLADGVTAATGRAGRALKRQGRDVASYAEHAADPLVGTRAAQLNTSLDDLVQNRISQGRWDANQQRHLDAYLGTQGVQFDDVKQLPLSGSVGFLGAVGNPLGATAGNALASALDYIPEAARWSWLGRTGHQLGSKLVGGLSDAVGQATATIINKAGKEGGARGNRASGDVAQLLQFAEIPDAVKQRTGITDVKDVRVQEALDRYIEGVAATAKDIDLIENTPKLKAIADYWGTARSGILQESKDAGLNAHQLQHKFGANYRPYMLTTGLDRVTLNGNSRGAYFDTVTGDMIAREKSLQLPGAIDQLRYYAKQPEFLSGRKDASGKLWSLDEVTDRLYREVNDPASPYYQTVPGTKAYQTALDLAAKIDGAPKYTRGNARAMAQFLGDLDPDDPVVFGNHPAEAIARYMTGRYSAIETGKALGEAVIGRAVKKTAGSATGEKMVPLTKALAIVGLKSQKVVGANGKAVRGGAQARARALLGDDNLAQYSVPQSFLDRLTESQNILKAPKAQSELGNFITQNLRAFKTQVLSWPSRVTRDWTSSAIGNFLLVKDPVALTQSMWNSQHMLDGNYDAVLPYIKTLPAYQSMVQGGKPDDEVLNAFLSDLAESGAMKGLGMVDRAVGDRTGKALLDVLPGSTPMPRPKISNVPSAAAEMLTDKNILDWYGIKGVSLFNGGKARKETNNPFFRKFEQASEWSDAHARLSGYMALLSKSVSPREAAAKLKRMHVDYDSLTDFEKRVRDVAFPFYSYNSRAGQFAVEELLNNPGGAYRHALQARERLQSQDENDPYLPTSYRERGGFTLSRDAVSQLGLPDSVVDAIMAPQGMSTVIGGVDMPGASVLDMLAYKPVPGNTVDSIANSITATAQNVGGQVSPLLRVGSEVLSRQDAATRRPIGEAQNQWDKVAAGLYGLTGGETDPRDIRLPGGAVTKWGLDLVVPGASRIAGFVGSALDPRLKEDRAKALLGATWNTVAPVRHYFVDEKQRLRDEQSAIDEILRGVPGRRSFSTVSIPEEKLAELPPEFAAMVARKKQISKQLKADKPDTPAEKRAKRFRATRSSRKERAER